MTPLVLLVALAGLGLVWGSFLNVVIHRLPRRQSLVWPGSACPACGHAIRWHDNVPVVGWLMLRGRCRHCGAPISIRYPIVESMTAGAFLACYWAVGPHLLLVPRLVLAAALIALFAIDLEHQLLPDRITLPGIVAGLVFSLFLPPGLRDAVIGVLIGGGVLWVLSETYFRVRGIEGMGFGDVKMLAMVGAWLGVKMVIVTFILSSMLGGLVGVILIGSRRADMATRVPFGTMLAVAALVASVYGEPLLAWYLSLMAA